MLEMIIRDAVVHGLRETADDDGIIDNALEKSLSRDDCQYLQNLQNIDPTGHYNSLVTAPVVEASLPSGPAATAETAPVLVKSSKLARQLPKINKRRVPKFGVKDVKVGQEVLVVNASFPAILLGILPDHPEAFNDNREPVAVASLVTGFYNARFRELGLPATEDEPAEPSLKAVNKVKGSEHGPGTVSEGRVATISMDVDQTGVPSFAPSMDFRRSAPVEDVEEVIAKHSDKPAPLPSSDLSTLKR